jgi:hypothetical protein
MRITINDRMFDRESKRSATIGARRLTGSHQSINEVNQHDVHESGQSQQSMVMRITSKYKNDTTIN